LRLQNWKFLWWQLCPNRKRRRKNPRSKTWWYFCSSPDRLVQNYCEVSNSITSPYCSGTRWSLGSTNSKTSPKMQSEIN
jgi:hypothetical protein